jgi:hypothetical protein
MALTYRNTIRKHVVTVAEPADILAAAEVEAERLNRLGTKDGRLDAERLMAKAQSQARHMRQTLTKMDQSRRWERYAPPPVVPASPPPSEALVPEAPAAKATKAAPVKAAAKADPEIEAA